MPVANIVDDRTNRYDVDVAIVYEFSWQDNYIEGASKFDEGEVLDCLCLYISRTTVGYAIGYANQRWPDDAVTIYLYDVCGNPQYADYDTITFENGIYGVQ